MILAWPAPPHHLHLQWYSLGVVVALLVLVLLVAIRSSGLLWCSAWPVLELFLFLLTIV